MRHFHVQEFAGHAQGFIVHEFDARRVDAGFEDLIGQGKGFFIGLEDADHIESIRRHRTEFDRDFRDDAQSPFRTGKELFQAEAGRTLLEAGTGVEDVPCRRNDFQAVDLMARRAVFNGFIAAGIVGDVAADHAAVGTGRVPGIEEAVFGSFTLQVPSDDASLADGIHIVGIEFEDLIHPFQFDDHAVINRNSTTGNTGTSRARRNRNEVLIGQFDDSGHFFRRAREDDDFRFMEIMGVPFFVCLVSFQIIFVRLDVFITDDLT